MDDLAPFSQETLNEIFKISPNRPDRVISRECGWLEFKESFGWASLTKYLRSCAAFANAKGGYLVFGIANRPHILKGLKGRHLEDFENLDPERMTNHLNEHFAPEIDWDVTQYDLSGNVYGIFYVHESKDKPVICCKDAGTELKEGDIYYRYRGRSQRIRYSELRLIIDARRQIEQRFWMQHLTNIARIGVREAGVFDLHTGQVTGTGGSFIIDESLLSQLTFIREGEFSEIKGRPTLKLIGTVEPMRPITSNSGRKQIVNIKTKGIRIGDIIGSFLYHDRVEEPSEFVKQICFESTAFLPVYYYVYLAGLNREDTIDMLEAVVSRSASKTKLIDRITDGTTQQLTLPAGDGDIAKKKRMYAELALNNKVDTTLSDKDLEYCLQAIRGLSPKEIARHSKYLREVLGGWFRKHYASAKGTLANDLRRTICWLDEALYKEKIGTKHTAAPGGHK